MIIVELCGGLGNQMFGYAAGRAISKRLNTNLVLNPFRINPRKVFVRREYSLYHFNIQEKIMARFSPLPYIMPSYAEPNFHYNPRINKIGDDTYLTGYFQSEKYFKSIEGIIRKEFTLKNPIECRPPSCCEMVSIHIRRGDYAENPEAFKVHGVLPLEYYYKAMDVIANKADNLVFNIFAEDINWVKENFKIPYPHIFISQGKDYQDIIRMANCQHHIIANSSFSWWGAWLCRNEDKIVVAPKKWFVDERMNTKDLIPEGWVRV